MCAQFAHTHTCACRFCLQNKITHALTHTDTALACVYVYKFSMSRYFVVSLRVIAVVVFEFYWGHTNYGDKHITAIIDSHKNTNKISITCAHRSLTHTQMHAQSHLNGWEHSTLFLLVHWTYRWPQNKILVFGFWFFFLFCLDVNNANVELETMHYLRAVTKVTAADAV